MLKVTEHSLNYKITQPYLYSYIEQVQWSTAAFNVPRGVFISIIDNGVGQTGAYYIYILYTHRDRDDKPMDMLYACYSILPGFL